jgi:hypothetical protein
LKNGISASLSSGIGIAKRSRISRIASSSSFLVWCAVLRASPDLPMPKPLTVFTSRTVGVPLFSCAILKAA